MPGLLLLLLVQLLALFWSIFSRRVCMLGVLRPPTVRPRSPFSFSLSLLLALGYPFHGLCDHVHDASPPHLVVLVAGVPLLFSILHSRHLCQPLYLLAGCPGFHQVCGMTDCSVQLLQFLCLLSYRPLHAARPVAGGRRGFPSPSPFSVLVSLHCIRYGCARSLCGDGCRRRRHLHRHVHWHFAPPLSSSFRVQVTPPAPSEFCYHSYEVSLLVLVVACLLVVA